jgi:homoaconitase/3-isopropylmalate dehydratase large subunit
MAGAPGLSGQRRIGRIVAGNFANGKIADERRHPMAQPRTLFDKIWESHVVDRQDDGTCLIYIDRHLVHEVTSPQAFEGLRLAGRKVRRPEATLAVPDHNVPTTESPTRKAASRSRRWRRTALTSVCRCSP